MRPEWALEGTVTTSELPERRRRAAGEKLLIRAPGELGKATTMPGSEADAFDHQRPAQRDLARVLGCTASSACSSRA